MNFAKRTTSDRGQANCLCPSLISGGFSSRPFATGIAISKQSTFPHPQQAHFSVLEFKCPPSPPIHRSALCNKSLSWPGNKWACHIPLDHHLRGILDSILSTSHTDVLVQTLGLSLHIVGKVLCLPLLCLIDARRERVCPLYGTCLIRKWDHPRHQNKTI